MEWLSDEQQRVWRNYLAMAGTLHTAMQRQLQQDCELSLSDYDVLVALTEPHFEQKTSSLDEF